MLYIRNGLSKHAQQIRLGLGWLFILALFSTGPTPVIAQQTEIPDHEYTALVALYESTGGDSWTNPWVPPTDQPCDLYGVTCDEGHVSMLDLDSNNRNCRHDPG